ncbi:helix-turn-helix domain-containing protein [Candidatus Kaiserbacteria bacterium]|nr:helix-turn-helix domain-containing protein [Candidatus Kaiserbacteria bacterium]
MLRNMRSKVQDRAKAIALRRQGKSYKEIQAKVAVSKGTLSKWLSNLPLSKREEKFLHERSQVLQDNGRLKTALLNREKNERRRDLIRVKARADFERYKDDPFFVLGLALYWAEGAKKNNYFSFINSDVSMVRIMMVWTTTYLPIEPVDFKFRLYIHKPYANEKCEVFWSRNCAIPMSQFQKTSYKPTPHTVKKNPDYKGCLRMVVSGINHLITIKTWQTCLSEYYVEVK